MKKAPDFILTAIGLGVSLASQANTIAPERIDPFQQQIDAAQQQRQQQYQQNQAEQLQHQADVRLDTRITDKL
ncbi:MULTISPECIES: hypothetical protein [unclassified Mannheimia]|uniref:hypothetical protein n=1 Tax=unclassified Mannheimia TaxID=2645054 RepID=UPI00359D1782